MMINDGDMSFISSDDEDYRWIQDYIDGKLILGLPTGCEALDKHFLFKRDFTIINGISNIGKSTFALYMITASAIRHNWRWIIYSAENRTAAVKMKLIQFATDMQVKDMKAGQLKQAYQWVNEHFTIISNKNIYSYTDLMVFAEKLVRQGNYDGYFIDPYNSLKIQMSTGTALSTHDYHYEAASEFLTFTQSHNMALWLSTHAITEAQRRKGEDGLPQAPYAEDTEGGGKFVNKSDNFLTFHRKIQAPDHSIRRTVEVHVRKVREVESGGEPTSLDYPVLFEMNHTNTGFVNKFTSKPLFTSILKPIVEKFDFEKGSIDDAF
jgi:replicative DNA helicase